MDNPTPLDWLGLSGLLAIIGGAVGYGQLHGRVKALEDRDASQENAIAIARLEEKFAAMSNDIQDIKRAVVK
jgi:hypothetical protein